MATPVKLETLVYILPSVINRGNAFRVVLVHCQCMFLPWAVAELALL
jgi:hypothetical protein